MITPVTGDGEFVSDLCRALGLDPGLTTGLNIRVRPGQVVTVTVGTLLVDKQAEKISTVVKKYALSLQDADKAIPNNEE